MSLSHARRAGVLTIWLGLSVACGGAATPLPTAPTPSAELPSGGACGALAGAGSLAILNGTECPAGASSVVLLNMRAADGFSAGACSGTVIGERAILTAAHCIDGDVAVVRLFVGSGLETVAESFTAHPAYRGGTTVDVGVVIMGQPIGRPPVPLLLGRDARVGEAAIVTGWGRNQNDVPSTLRAGLTSLTAVGFLLETQFGTNVSSVCSGDSGGPILLSEGGVWSVGGVISATSENVCNTGTNYYVAVRNAAVSTFILSQVPDARQR